MVFLFFRVILPKNFHRILSVLFMISKLSWSVASYAAQQSAYDAGLRPGQPAQFWNHKQNIRNWTKFVSKTLKLAYYVSGLLDKSCDIVNTRVFSSRRQLRRYKIRQRKRQKRRKNRRVKRDHRSLLAVSEPKFWPKWCHKVAFFRVFRKDLTLCLYSKRFSEDPILAFSNPRLGTTIYGYADKKYYSELGKTYFIRNYVLVIVSVKVYSDT